MAGVIRGSIVLLFAALLSACATQESLRETERLALESRVEARWRAMEQRDWSGVYSYATPAYRAIISESMFAQKFSYMLEWELTSVELVNYDADAAVASVAVRVMSRPVKLTSAASKAMGALPSRQVEQWVLVDGQWWYSATL